jgi:osmotically inducible protein OsmC
MPEFVGVPWTIPVRAEQPCESFGPGALAEHKYDDCTPKRLEECEMMQRKASATWTGELKSGRGAISSASKALSMAAYSFGTRFENEVGTNPEELIAAAHAACFSMALSHEIEKSGGHPNDVTTHCTISLDQVGGSWRIIESHLEVTVDAARIADDAFQRAAAQAKDNCPISLLLNARITMNARLKQQAA